MISSKFPSKFPQTSLQFYIYNELSNLIDQDWQTRLDPMQICIVYAN